MNMNCHIFVDDKENIHNECETNVVEISRILWASINTAEWDDFWTLITRLFSFDA